MIKLNRLLLVLSISGLLLSCSKKASINNSLVYSVNQLKKILSSLPADTPNIPRSIKDSLGNWSYVNYKDWTSGFWGGELWYAYEFTKDKKFEQDAERFTSQLYPLSVSPAFDHDLGFQVFNSYGNGYRLTKNEAYKKVILNAADTLATLFNPKVGTILSWPRPVPNMEWPQHNTIIDNMINLELLFWAAKNGGGQHLYDIALSHAKTTMKNHFRPDYSSYHVVIYDKETGKKIKAVTHQGYSDSSMWARGQSWAIYGFTMCYRFTKDPQFLDFAQKVSDVYLARLPKDKIPYWDFDDPAIPNTPRDASAAAITASGLLELSTFVKDKTKAEAYRKDAETMLKELSSERYKSGTKNTALIMHVTGHKPNNSEVDTSINYGDYYYMEALLRLKKLQEGKSIYNNL
ncbi:MAG TPA: glycoside hydrolase family 88 protein [Pelobium sp.]|nr:glycoside hydrolase family 88 protein [Pelobium sp.]